MYIKNGGVSLAMYISDHGLVWSGFFVFSSPPSLFSYHNSLMYMMYRHIRVFKRYGEMKSREKTSPVFNFPIEVKTGPCPVHDVH